MWFANIIYKSGCKVGLHFYNYDEVNEWFKAYLLRYLTEGVIDIKIYFNEKDGEDL